MKKLMVAVLVTIGMISMVGCSDTPKNAEKMYIEPAQLTEEEEKIATLLGLNTQQKIYDFVLDEFMNDQWFIFATEEVRNQIQFPEEEMENIRFHDKVFQKSDLSEETTNWLENYNSLSEEEQLSISGIPAELYELCGYPLEQDMKVNDELPDIEAFVAENLITENEKILTAEEGVTIADILEKEEWMEGAPACDNDYKIVINKETYYYHSECGTFVDTINNKSKSLDEEEREKVNQLIRE